MDLPSEGNFFVAFGGAPTDYPDYLAEHWLRSPWPNESWNYKSILFRGNAGAALIKALVDSIRGLARVKGEHERNERLRAWFDSSPKTAIYVNFDGQEPILQLPEIVRDVRQYIESLGCRSQIGFFFYCVKDEATLPFWWRWYRKLKPGQSLEEVRRLKPLGLVTKHDVGSWYAGYPHQLHALFDHGLIRDELYKEFVGRSELSYHELRDRLVNGLLKQAMKRSGQAIK